MCGIAGHIGPESLSKDRISACLSLMARRGPDAHASYEHRFSDRSAVTLIHSRLKIIDLNDRANQPFKLGDKVLIYNGEIYNYQELKNDLLNQGRQFHTKSDTEVLMQMWNEKGPSALNQCEGMWAFAVYDEARGTLSLSRDRFGEKPLYYYFDPSGLYFGSEVKFIAAMLGHSLAVNYRQLYRYLINGYKSLYKQRETFFKGLKEIIAGTVLEISAESKEPHILRFWFPTFNPEESLTFEEAIRGTKERLMRSVELRLRSDVPLAFCMSGGVDSNALISIAKKIFNYHTHGFTIANTDPRYSEQNLVHQAAAVLEIEHTDVPLSSDGFLDNLSTLVKQHDAPIYTISYYVQWLLMNSVAKHGYRIAISGTAADELFSGYYDHYLAYFYEIRNDCNALEEAQAYWKTHILPAIRNPHLKDPNLFVKDPTFRGHIFLNAESFSGYLQKTWEEPFEEAQFTDSLLRNRMMNELFHEAIPVILHEDDLNAMYYSIENRSPFLDKGLFEFCYSIPNRHLMRGGQAKTVLREAVRGIIPDCILDNKAKMGFNAPISSLIDLRASDVRAKLLDDSPIYQHVKKNKIEQMLTKTELLNSESKFLFNFINSKLFLERYAS